MSAFHAETAHGRLVSQEGIGQQTPQIEGIHGHQLGNFSGFVLFDEPGVAGHLGADGLGLHGLGQAGIPGGVHEGGKMLKGKIQCSQAGLGIQGVEGSRNKMGGRIPLLQHPAELLDGFAQSGGFHRVQAVARGDLHEDLVDEVYVAERQFVGAGRPGQQLDDVFFKAEAQAVHGEKNGAECHQEIQQSLSLVKEPV